MRVYRLLLSMTCKDGRPGCGYSAGAPSLASALSDAFSMACYYLSIEYGAVGVRVYEVCEVCDGAGRIFAKRPRRCPECKGKDSERLIVETTYKPYDSGNSYVSLFMHDRPSEAATPPTDAERAALMAAYPDQPRGAAPKGGAS